MPAFSKRSRAELATCDERLRQLFALVVETYDCTVLEGHRTSQRQRQLVNEGRSKTMASLHVGYPSRAVDVAPHPIDWGDGRGKKAEKARARFYHFAGYVLAVADDLGLRVRWGGDWDGDKNFNDQRFDDLVHWELLED